MFSPCREGGNRGLCPQKKFAHKGGAVRVCDAHCVHAHYAKEAHCTLSKGSSLHTAHKVGSCDIGQRCGIVVHTLCAMHTKRERSKKWRWCVHTMQYAHKEKQLGQAGLNFLKLHPNGPKPLYCCCSLQGLNAKAISCAISLFSSVCPLSAKPFCLLLPWALALNQIKLALPFSLAF